MLAEIRKTIELFWQELVDFRFDEQRFVDDLIQDCGEDASGLSPSDFTEVLDGKESSCLEDIYWTFNEVLAYYLSDDLGSAAYVRALFVSLVLADAIGKGIGDWQFVFDKICILMVQNTDKGDAIFRMNFLSMVLSDYIKSTS